MDSWVHFVYKMLLYKVVCNKKQISSISQYVYWYSNSDEFKFLTIYRNDRLLIHNETLPPFINMSSRSSHPEELCEKAVPEKHQCQILFLNKSQAETYKFIKKRLSHRCFPVNFEKCLRTHFLQNTFGRLFLILLKCTENIIDCRKFDTG